MRRGLIIFLIPALSGCQLFSPGEQGPVYCPAVVTPPPSVVITDTSGAPAAEVEVAVEHVKSGRVLPCIRNAEGRCIIPGEGRDEAGHVTGRYYIQGDPGKANTRAQFNISAKRGSLRAAATVTLLDNGCNIVKTAGPDTLRLGE